MRSGVSPGAVRPLSPHQGRDWWACRYLEERMKQHSELLQQVLNTPNISREHSMVLALKDCAMTVIQMEIAREARTLN